MGFLTRLPAASPVLRGVSSWLLLAGLVLLATGCQTYNVEPAIALYERGRFAEAYDELAPQPWWKFWRRRYDHDEMLWLLEEGKVLQELGRYDESGDKLNEALERFTRSEELEAEISITDELDGIARGLVWREYRGSYPIAIQGYTLLALSDLAVGNLSNAGASCRNAIKWQSEILIHREKAIERAKKLGEKKQIELDELLADEKVRSHTDAAYLNPHVNPGYQDYLNPFASFVTAMVFALQQDSSAGQFFTEVAGMVPGNEYVAALAAGELSPNSDVVYVLYEHGLAPRKIEERITIPTPLFGITSIAWPRLVFVAPETSHLAVEAGGSRFETQSLSSMDSIIASQFRHELKGIIMRTVIAHLAREGAAKAVELNTKKNDELGTALRVLSQVWKVGASGADLRTWRTLGSDYQVAVIPRPPGQSIELSLAGLGGGTVARQSVTIGPDVTVIRARSIGTHTLVADRIWPLPDPRGEKEEVDVLE